MTSRRSTLPLAKAILLPISWGYNSSVLHHQVVSTNKRPHKLLRGPYSELPTSSPQSAHAGLELLALVKAETHFNPDLAFPT